MGVEFTVALACGLRQSEALGLRWRDVDLDSNVLSIHRTIQHVNRTYQALEPKENPRADLMAKART